MANEKVTCECRIEVCRIDATACGGSWHTTIRTGYQAADSRLVHFKRCFPCQQERELHDGTLTRRLVDALREILKFGYHGKHRKGYGSCGLCDSRAAAESLIAEAERTLR